MELVAGTVLGAAIIFFVIAFAMRNPTKPLKRRNDTDHGGWNDTNSNSSQIP